MSYARKNLDKGECYELYRGATGISIYRTLEKLGI
jgi:hypothetical protein